MKHILAVACLGALFAASTLQAQYPPPVPEEMGTKVEIGRQVDLGTVDRSYLTEPDVRSIFRPMWGYDPTGLIKCVVWSPDGGSLYFSDLNYIYSVPATGGAPKLIFDSYYLYPFEGKRYVLNQAILEIAGVSPDGEYIYFTRSRFDAASGAEVTITPKGNFYSAAASSWAISVERLTIRTGEIRTLNSDITEMCVDPLLSPSGRYLTFEARNKDKLHIVQRVIDTTTLEEWEIPVLKPWGFSGNENLYYSLETQLYRIPIHGGDPVPMATLASGVTTQPGLNFNTPILDMGFSPDGKWALAGELTGDRYRNTITKPDGNKFSVDNYVTKLCILDLGTGEISDLLPTVGFLSPFQARFSPDGTQFCYILENDENEHYSQEFDIYIKDFNPIFGGNSQQLAVTDAAPAGFALAGNYPNPFNPSTTISFTLPSSGSAALSIYSVAGQKVRELVSGPMSAGAHSVVWDGRDDSGRMVSSGIYLSRLSQGTQTLSGRMLLMK